MTATCNILTATALALAVPNFAQASNCSDRESIVDRLANHWHENKTGGGLQRFKDNETLLIELWSSQQTGTFTLLVTRPDGMTCIIATGTDWHQQKPVLEKAGEPG